MGASGKRAAGWVGVAAAVVLCPLAWPGAHKPCTFGLARGGCSSCHQFERGFSHPVGVVPSMAVPFELPLPGGRMACLTCHDPDRSDEPGPGLRRGGAATHDDRALCRQCHDPQSGERGDLHAVGARAHLLTRSRPSKMGGAATDQSQTCLGCHDGAIAPAAAVRTGPPGPMSLARILGDHPIGVEQRWRGAGDNLRPPEEVDPVVRLFGGRVGCGSCHSPYSDNEHQLVMTMQRSRLCLACHDF